MRTGLAVLLGAALACAKAEPPAPPPPPAVDPAAVPPAVAARLTRVVPADTPGNGLRIVGRALDGVAEAIQAADRPVVGVQWHPEFFVDIDPLFSWLVDAATSRRTNSSHQIDHHRMEDNNVTYA